MKISLEILVMIVGICKAEASSWSHINQAEWRKNYETCGLERQSPIAINAKEIIPLNMPPLNFHNYDLPHTATISNNGHTVKFVFPNSLILPEISGGPLKPNDKYVFESAHFHWGANDTIGSEHIVNGQRYPMEMHVVHRNAKYSSKTEAQTKPDGVAVVARFFATKTIIPFSPLNQIINTLSSIRKFEAETEMLNFKLSDFMVDVMASDKQIFYTYKGSVTTPPCSEIVDWIGFLQPIRVTSSQLAPFRTLRDEHGSIIANNFRHLQKVGERKVYLRSI